MQSLWWSPRSLPKGAAEGNAVR